MKKGMIIMVLLTISLLSCSNREFCIDYDNFGFVQMAKSENGMEFTNNCHLIGSMDTEVDTFSIFKVKIPPRVKEWNGSGNVHQFTYNHQKTILMHLDYQSRNTSSKFTEQVYSDSLLLYCHSFDFDMREQIISSNSNSSCKCLVRGKSVIFILNFDNNEVPMTIEQIQNSFRFLPW